MEIPVPGSLFNKVAGLRATTLLKKGLWHKCFPVNFAKFLRTPFLQNTPGWLLLTKLHHPNRRKMRLPCFELRWLLDGMNMPWHSLFSFLFFFLFRNDVIREQLDENDFRRCYILSQKYYSESTWSQLCSKFFINNYEATWQQHLKDTLYFMDIGVKLTPRHLTYYCMLLFLSNKPSF